MKSTTVRIGLLVQVAGRAAGDLFDNDYKDCPTKIRLRDGQISDLAVNPRP